MEDNEKSPRIEDIQWGQIVVEGVGRFKDVKLYPGGAREWDWNETSTDHHPGIQRADVQELLDHGVQVVVLSKGYLGRLETMPETLEQLQAAGIRVYVEGTEAAVARYNALCEEAAVGALIHSTC